MSFRTLKRIVEESDTRTGKVFDLSIQALIVLSLVTFSIETLPNLDKGIQSILKAIEIICILVFTIEYLLRIIVADNKMAFISSFYGVIDLCAILPFYLATSIDLRAIRIFRLFRLVRVFKIFRYSKALSRLGSAFLEIKSELIIFLIATHFLIFMAGVGIYYFENPAQPDKFASIFHCLWWAVATLTTVGYGDVFPVTIGGRLFTFLILMIGLGVVAVPAGLLASALTTSIEKEKGQGKSKEG